MNAAKVTSVRRELIHSKMILSSIMSNNVRLKSTRSFFRIKYFSLGDTVQRFNMTCESCAVSASPAVIRTLFLFSGNERLCMFLVIIIPFYTRISILVVIFRKTILIPFTSVVHPCGFNRTRPLTSDKVYFILTYRHKLIVFFCSTNAKSTKYISR